MTGHVLAVPATERSGEPSAPSAPLSRWGVVARLLPWAAVGGLLARSLVTNGTSGADTLRYAAYVAIGLALPGTLVLRALVRRRRPLAEDLVLGTMVGMAVQLALFVPAVALGLQPWLRWWPVAVVLLFSAVPGLRRHWRSDRAQRGLPVLWHWGTATAAVTSALVVLRSVSRYPLPPGEGPYYVDVPWHLGIVHALNRSIPPETPQVDGLTLRYHWFSHADMAAAHLVSGVPEAVVLLRPWPVVMAVLLVLGAATLARELSGISWAGPLAAWVVGSLTAWQVLPLNVVTSAVAALSPSQAYVAPLAVGAGLLVVRALRGEPLRGGWLLVPLLALAAGGSKPTALPMLACGALLVLVAGAVFFRTRAALVPAAATLASCAVLFPLTSRFLSGSDSESIVTLFDFVEWLPLYHDLTGQPRHPAVGPILPEGLADLTSGRSVQILALLLLAVLVPQAPVFASAVALLRRRVRQDPAAWFLAGVIGSAYGGYFLLAHPAYSQVYFVRLGLAFMAPLLAWVVAAAVERVRAPRAGRVLVLVVGVALGLAAAWLARQQTPQVAAADQGSLPAWREAFLAPLLVLLACLAAAGVLVLVGRRAGLLPRHAGPALLASAAVVGVPLLTSFEPAARAVMAEVRGERATPVGGIPTPAGGGAAMDWLNRHVPEDAVVATNRHCSTGKQRPGCVSNVYYVSGLGGRQTVLESWAYVSVSGGPKDRNNPYPERLAANDALFTDPSPEAFGRMKREFDVTWLVADSTSTPVSARITEFATPRFHAGTVTVYEVK